MRSHHHQVSHREERRQKNLSYSLKVNEFVALTTSESISRYTGYKPNNVWSDLKHLRAHEHAECSNLMHGCVAEDIEHPRSCLPSRCGNFGTLSVILDTKQCPHFAVRHATARAPERYIYSQ